MGRWASILAHLIVQVACKWIGMRSKDFLQDGEHAKKGLTVRVLDVKD